MTLKIISSSTTYDRSQVTGHSTATCQTKRLSFNALLPLCLVCYGLFIHENRSFGKTGSNNKRVFARVIASGATARTAVATAFWPIGAPASHSPHCRNLRKETVCCRVFPMFSRACLGKMIVCYIQMAKKNAFSPFL